MVVPLPTRIISIAVKKFWSFLRGKKEKKAGTTSEKNPQPNTHFSARVAEVSIPDHDQNLGTVWRKHRGQLCDKILGRCLKIKEQPTSLPPEGAIHG